MKIPAGKKTYATRTKCINIRGTTWKVLFNALLGSKFPTVLNFY